MQYQTTYYHNYSSNRSQAPHPQHMMYPSAPQAYLQLEYYSRGAERNLYLSNLREEKDEDELFRSLVEKEEEPVHKCQISPSLRFLLNQNLTFDFRENQGQFPHQITNPDFRFARDDHLLCIFSESEAARTSPQWDPKSIAVRDLVIKVTSTLKMKISNLGWASDLDFLSNYKDMNFDDNDFRHIDESILTRIEDEVSHCISRKLSDSYLIAKKSPLFTLQFMNLRR